MSIPIFRMHMGSTSPVLTTYPEKNNCNLKLAQEQFKVYCQSRSTNFAFVGVQVQIIAITILDRSTVR